jgi:hypothetical protein
MPPPFLGIGFQPENEFINELFPNLHSEVICINLCAYIPTRLTKNKNK